MPSDLDKAVESSAALAKKAQKPGFLTSEFWMAAVSTIIGALVKFGVIASATSPVASAIGSIMIVAGPIVYILARSGIKKGAAEALGYLAAELNKKNK